MSTPEGHTKDSIKRMLQAGKDAGAKLDWWMPTPAPGSVGLPDFIICADGHFVAVETKAPKAEGGRAPTKLQQATLQRITDAGGLALVVQEEADYHALHQHLGTAAWKTWACPPWRSAALTKRKAPPK